MKKGKFFVLGMLAAALTFGLISTGCDIGTNTGTNPGGNTFVTVTNITDAPTIAIMNTPLTLRGTVVPANAANKTIAWSGSGVSNGGLTATSAGTWTVTATIANGASASSSYTQTFNIKVYDAGNDGGSNPFGNDTTPFIWGMENSGGVYVKVKDSTWESWESDGTPGDSGTYVRIGETAGAWGVTANGDTGLAVFEDGKLLVRNLISGMNGTFTKLEAALTLTGTWKTSGPSYDTK
ncbi:MAG: hypothetical protein LBD47_08865 [Treponema sp.]|nr:hypothetical protein [Treponema sp.]